MSNTDLNHYSGTIQFIAYTERHFMISPKMASNNYISLHAIEFESIVKSYCQELQTEKDLCDLTLACEDKQIQTHKFLMSSFSPVLKNILKLNPNQHPVIYLTRIRFKDLHSLVNFMYRGEIEIAEEDLISFLKVAKDLNIRGLSISNDESSKSNTKSPPESHHQDNSPSEKQKRILNNYQTTNIHSVVPTRKFDMNNSHQPAEITNPNCIDNSVQSIDLTELENFIHNEDTVINNDETDINNDDTDINNDDTHYSHQPPEIMRQNNNDNTTQNIIGDKKFACTKCPKYYSSKRNLNEHNRTSHEGIRYPCSECNFKSTRKGNLQEHIKAIHEGVLLPCTECNYTAKHRFSLKTHVAVVHKGVIYPCSECDYKATTKPSLQQHMAAIHEGVKYACTECNYKATSNGNLKVHISGSHEGIKYPCTECDYEATRKQSLQKHVAVIHEVNMSFSLQSL